MTKPRKIKVKYRKLGKERAEGQAYIKRRLVEIDIRLKGKDQLAVLIHESAHIILPYLNEEEIIRLEQEMTEVVWEHWGQKYYTQG